MSRPVEIRIKRISEGRYMVERDDLPIGEPGEMNLSQVRLYLHNRVPDISADLVIHQADEKGQTTVRFQSPV